MTFRNPRLWIAILSAVTVVSFAIPHFRSASPGPLSAVHQRESKLTGWSSCAQCHGGWFGNMTGACLECHAEIGEQMDARRGLHGVMGRTTAARCAVCHSEHHGPDFAMVNRQSFARAGAPDQEAFRHELVGFAMDGRHLELDCTECHPNARVPVLPPAGRRFVGLDQDCVTCHDDAHRGLMTIGCSVCHGQRAFTELHSAGHERYLPLVGGHAGVSCRGCHAEGDPHSLEVLGGGGVKPAPRECTACHESPHRPGVIEGAAGIAAAAPAGGPVGGPVPGIGTRLPGERPTPGSACVICHEAPHTSFRDERIPMTPALHASSGFPLGAPHDKAACKDCHAERGKDFAARHPGRGPDQCVSCHEDPHGGQFATGPFAAQGCVACHDRQHFEPHAFTTGHHAKAALELTGRHLAVECHTCHEVPAAGGPRVFRGTPSTCAGCHGDAHVGYFAKFVAELSTGRHGTCAHCHTTETFSELPAGFDHGRWTGFPVAGAHVQAGCESCHRRGAEPDRNGRTFGRVADVSGPLKDGGRSCSCHQDPHAGGFDGPKHPRVVAGLVGCARCHVQTSFRALPDGFDHGLWTAWPLEGAHGKARCSSCHTPLPRADELGRTWERARGRQCADCHADAHAGQFAVAGRTDCARCHLSVAQFEDTTFRHDLHSRFRLGEAHTPLACSACHQKERRGDVEVVRYRPLGIECVDCHGEQAEPFRRRRGKGT